MARNRPAPAGFSLIEILIVIALMGILAAVVLPSSNPTIHDQLHSAAQIMATDLAYARSLAVTQGSTYKITFEADNNRYVLSHSGSNPALDRLPPSPFRNPDDPPERHVVDLDEIPHLGPPVEIVTVLTGNSASQPTGEIEFGPLGETTATAPTAVWLSAGAGSARRYIVLYVDPVTGLTAIGPFSGSGPESLSTEPAVVSASL
jgi:prepilin-type N-terminal cleavage/methylation domain-containing protein